MPADTIATASRLEPPAAARRSRLQALHSRPVALALKFAVSAALIVIVARHVDIAALGRQVGGQSRFWLGVAAAIGLVQIALLALRWQRILAALDAGVAPLTALAVTAMSCFFNAWLAGPTGGDVARAVLAPARALGRMGIVHSVLFDRAVTMAGMGLVAAPLALLDLGPLARHPALLIALAAAPVPFIGLTVLGLLARRFAGRGRAVAAHLHDLGRDWRRFCRAWPRFSEAVVVAVLGQAAIAAEAWSLAQAQHLDVSFLDFLMLMPPVLLVAALPVSVGGWGVREGAMVAALGAAGVAASAALLLSVELGLVAMLVSLPGGVIWLHRWHGRAPVAAAASL